MPFLLLLLLMMMMMMMMMMQMMMSIFMNAIYSVKNTQSAINPM